MFRRVRDFARRHKGKLIFVGVVGSAAYFAGRYAERKLREWQEAAAVDVLESTRKQMHFDATQRTCSESTASFLTSIQSRIDSRFDSEAVIAEIKAPGGVGTVSKMPLWERLKVVSVCRAFAGVYGGALLAVLVRVQLNVVGGYMYLRSGSGAGDSENSGAPSLSQENQEEYLSAMKRFVDEGFPKFCDDLERLVTEIVSQTSLKDKLNFERVTSLVYSVKNEVDAFLQPKLTDFLYPDQDQLEEASSLSSAVQETRALLENPDVFSLVRHLTQMGVNDVLDAFAREWIKMSNNQGGDQHNNRVESASAEAGSAERKPPSPSPVPEANANVIPQKPLFHQFSMPFAKLLPLFASFPSSTVLRGLSSSDQLKTFSANVYESFSAPLEKI